MVFSCEICYECYSLRPPDRVPRVLPKCGHDFCTHCVSELYISSTPRCPVCRTEILDSLLSPQESNDNNNSTNISTSNHDVVNDISDFVTKRRARVTECPVVWCLVDALDRIDPRIPESAAMFTRAVSFAPTRLLERELELRRQEVLLASLPTAALRDELNMREEGISSGDGDQYRGLSSRISTDFAGIQLSCYDPASSSSKNWQGMSVLNSCASSDNDHRNISVMSSGTEWSWRNPFRHHDVEDVGQCTHTSSYGLGSSSNHVDYLGSFSSSYVGSLLSCVIFVVLYVSNALSSACWNVWTKAAEPVIASVMAIWKSMGRAQKLQVFMIAHSFPMLCLAIYYNLLSRRR